MNIGFYPNPEDVLGWHGWIEDKKRNWIVFFRPGEFRIWAEREKGGGVIGDPTILNF